MGDNGNKSSSSKPTTAKDGSAGSENPTMKDLRKTTVPPGSAEDAATNVDKLDSNDAKINEHLYVLRLSENALATKIMAFMQPSADAYPYNRYFRTGKDLTKEEATVAWKTQGQGCADIEFMQINGVDKNVQKVLFNIEGKAELGKYKEDPYDFEEEDAKLFHPKAFGKTETEFFRKKGSQYQMKNGENIKLWWANVQDAVLAYYLLKYPDASVAKAKYEQGVKDYNNGKKTSEYVQELKKAFRRSGRFMWAEWEPVQGIHRGVDFVITDSTSLLYTGPASERADIHAITDGVIIEKTGYSICVKSGSSFLDYVHMEFDKKMIVGYNVKAGEVIGKEYVNGFQHRTSYIHTHLEYRTQILGYIETVWDPGGWPSQTETNSMADRYKKDEGIKDLNNIGSREISESPYTFFKSAWIQTTSSENGIPRIKL